MINRDKKKKNSYPFMVTALNVKIKSSIPHRQDGTLVPLFVKHKMDSFSFKAKDMRKVGRDFALSYVI